ncbi:hypothetical protein [Tropicimonas isoalkanivorans]|uniref:Uncharacterized protein n=1 Tax=Tropicimonas isoalkanivorans TaxID=441112 RepID=A0A1I1Q498_9RHOB|nr:hypothetical protein [Tropicimonas isoalkanivorans]SFD16954.1 hypothetical protein SAMN04488094_11835 [Tropicimonas isoalkanivorans]
MTTRFGQDGFQTAVAFFKALPSQLLTKHQEARDERHIRRMVDELDWRNEGPRKAVRRKNNPLSRR